MKDIIILVDIIKSLALLQAQLDQAHEDCCNGYLVGDWILSLKEMNNQKITAAIKVMSFLQEEIPDA